ncbi:hypothetical protein PILCRDRAFT_820560 [Piloderma croceum F 1598]|uniref:Gfd2/YDR514C-like C-terminal domain-containing protein n=1 Tax=Piloderma croceum (strain F 1598) TaxID=765440 RepID=A0A0C3FC58_PILCF|nr:hypothetical protein PILCRDRAFT_820560 [Piloderma croceum F 1598]
MSDFNLVDPRGWEYDLQSVYSAYMGHFQLHSIPWYERSWGHLFESFEEFLAFSWPVITVTDVWTSKPHVVTRMTSIGAFLKMIKTRFGETLPMMDNMLKVTPFETSQRHLRTISDYAAYKKLHQTLPAAVLAALKTRIRSGEPKAIQELWEQKDKTFLAIDFEWSERNTSSCLEWGYATVRCGHLDALGIWPPAPDSNYRKGHYIVSEYVDKVLNKHCPTYPWEYAFGESQVIAKSKLPVIIQAVISSLVSPGSDTTANNLVLVAHGLSSDLQRLEEMKIKLPHNVLMIDTASYERALFSMGERGSMQDPRTGQPRASGSTLSLSNLLSSTNVDVQCTMHNSGNDAFMCLFALQKLLDPMNTVAPEITMKKKKNAGGPSKMFKRSSVGPASPMFASPIMPMMTGQRFPGRAMAPNAVSLSNRSSSGPTGKLQANGIPASANEFGQARMPKSSHPFSTTDRRSSVVLTGEGKRSSSAPVQPTSSMP